jgi:hypothetical protein
VLFFNGHAVEAQMAVVPALSVDMPHGGCRLSIWKDGQAWIAYGSMPRRVAVTPGTFDFDRVADLLRAKSYAPDDRPFDGQRVGTVALPGPEAEGLRRIEDAGWVRSLLDRAWKARMAPSRDSPAEDHGWVAEVCAFAE